VCLVPEKRQELTTEGGLDMSKKQTVLKKSINQLKSAGIMVSAFVDPIGERIEQARQLGVDAVELHTGAYAAKSSSRELIRLEVCAVRAHHLGLQVNAGHGIDYTNVKSIVKLPHCAELNIGFSIVARALFVGLSAAVREMLDLINQDVPKKRS
ncbi:MAG: pyridoxine 5'-phosphate synthase, partial [Elusimicrobia bacterium]|nr:pyridoxine 5'-phosphate synthase [Elusimicrobiota bacterium]MBD3412227.1 pyridoxine 5'-phosphate synthase [Elusimicrobiota bacterium]